MNYRCGCLIEEVDCDSKRPARFKLCDEAQKRCYSFHYLLANGMPVQDTYAEWITTHLKSYQTGG